MAGVKKIEPPACPHCGNLMKRTSTLNAKPLYECMDVHCNNYTKYNEVGEPLNKKES
jgi:hypothetical protein